MSPTDALALGVPDGERVRVVSRYGAAILSARISPAMSAGHLFATFHTSEVFLNAVTSSHRDSVVGTPEYKVTAVQVERLNIAGHIELMQAK